MTPRVLFDSQIFCAQEFGGISRYFASIARSMWLTELARPLIVAPVHINEYAEKLPRHLVVGRRMSARGKPMARALSLVIGGAYQYGYRPDIVHHTYYYPVPCAPRSARSVLTVYDMIHEREPNTFSLGDPIAGWKARAVAKADHIICISEHTRRELIDILDVPEKKVSVTHLGYDVLSVVPPESAAESGKSAAEATQPYLLFVGARGGYKNFAGLLAAYASSPWLRSHFGIRCFGGGPFTPAERDLVARAGLGDRVLQLGGSDAVLASCYRHAALFVYPSRYEGFGIPPLEAMSLDCAVACSNTTSLPEVVGDAAACFDPSDPDAMRDTLERTLGSADALAGLIARGRLRCAQFSWARCARETVKIYKETS